jgi:hypothetical protein
VKRRIFEATLNAPFRERLALLNQQSHDPFELKKIIRKYISTNLAQ